MLNINKKLPVEDGYPIAHGLKLRNQTLFQSIPVTPTDMSYMQTSHQPQAYNLGKNVNKLKVTGRCCLVKLQNEVL